MMEQAKNWHFTSYGKIPETPEQWQLDEAGFRQMAKATWVVTEKVHGANFCLLTDGQTIVCANRKHVLGPRDDFSIIKFWSSRLNRIKPCWTTVYV